jgi:hypothetical protein
MLPGEPDDGKAHWNQQLKAALVVVLALALLLYWLFNFFFP